ncbi:MAG TPA: substrate-binding domain-containing protein, partial [Leptolyngbyaceae cyanobacterium M65_K2018_010]|nr:substrate-binding domain-containing protein [Leptolyngbyaceae cyanobacterium M65_K2018_010]
MATPLVFALTLTLDREARLWAQTPNPLEGVQIPTTLEAGTQLAIQSSEAMRPINEALASRFSEQYGNVPVNVVYNDADTALKALADQKTDLAAIGRGLTESELQSGLQQIPLSRHKIAIIVSPENPFNGSLTIEQFAQIFRGEITNWSQVGGPDAPIVLIDRPVTSDTRQAFRNYPVFQNAPFQAAAGATVLQTDDTAAVIQDLGPTGISYAIADQVIDNPAVKIVPMHETLPDDPRYPFSQPLAYVYRANDPSPAALAFLGYATNPDNEAIIEAARATAGRAETPAPTEAPVVVEEQQEVITETEAPVAAPARRLPWWPWLLALPILGGLLWWLMRGTAPVAAPVAATGDRRIILTPRDCRDAYAYWEVP